jgi:hypothetical protein
MMKNIKPLNDLELHEILRLIYPEHIRSDDDAYFELSGSALDAQIDLGDGFKVTLADFLARIVMLTMPMWSELSGTLYHCLGEVTITKDTVRLCAAVRRDVAHITPNPGAAVRRRADESC